MCVYLRNGIPAFPSAWNWHEESVLIFKVLFLLFLITRVHFYGGGSMCTGNKCPRKLEASRRPRTVVTGGRKQSTEGSMN